jgi:hypothetical protein
MSEYIKKRRISKRTSTTRLFTDDERELQRRVMNEGKDRSEVIRQAVSNSFRTERLALARKDETMQPVIDTYRKFMEEATGGLRNQVIHLTSLVEGLRATLTNRQAVTNEHLQTLTCTSRYNTEQAIVIRALMQLYIFHVHQQLAMQTGVDIPLAEDEFAERVLEFRHEAGNEMARIFGDSADSRNQGEAERLVERLYRSLERPLYEPLDGPPA